MNTQDSQSEGEKFEHWLDEQLTGGWATGDIETELRMAVSQIRYMPKSLPKDYAVQPLKRFIEAYVTTRVKEAERLARIKETEYWRASGFLPLFDADKRTASLTTTPNGKEDK